MEMINTLNDIKPYYKEIIVDKPYTFKNDIEGFEGDCKNACVLKLKFKNKDNFNKFLNHINNQGIYRVGFAKVPNETEGFITDDVTIFDNYIKEHQNEEEEDEDDFEKKYVKSAEHYAIDDVMISFKIIDFNDLPKL